MAAEPLTWITANLVYARSVRDPWAVFSLGCTHHEHRPASERYETFARVRALLLDLACDVQILRPHRWWDPERYLAERLADPAGPHPAARYAYLTEQADQLDGAWMPSETFLAVSLTASRRHAMETASELLADPTAELGRLRDSGRKLALHASHLELTEVEQHRRQAATAADTIAKRLPGSRPATRSELEWLVRRAWTRGIGDPVLDDAPEPLPPVKRSKGGKAAVAPRSVELLGWTGYLGSQHRGRLLADGELGESHQVGLIASTMPGDGHAGDEVLELLFGPQDDLAFPVDLAVCCTYVSPARAQSQVRAEMARADEQLDEHDEANRGASDETIVRAHTARDAETYLKDGLPLWEATFSVLVGAPTAEQATAHAKEAVSAMRRRGVQLRVAIGQQRQLFLEHLPGQRSWTSGYTRRLTVEQLAAMAPAAAHRLGTGRGHVWGHGSRSPTVLYFDPEDGPRLNRPAGLLVVGDAGAGKTQMFAKLCTEGFLAGHRIVDWVGKTDDHHWHKHPLVAEHTTHLELDDFDALAGILDPWVNAAPVLAAVGAKDFLTSLLPLGISPQWQAGLEQAVRAVRRTERPTNWAVVEQLAQGDKDAKAMAEHLAGQADSGLARLGFSRDGRRMLADRQVTHLEMENLPVPERGVARSEWTASERQGAAVVKLVALLAGGVLIRHPDVFKVFAVDEAKTMLDDPDGRRLIDQLQRIGRSKRAMVALATQYATDVGTDRDSIGGLFSSVWCFRAPDELSAERSCQLLGLPPDPGMVGELLSLPSGTAFVRDQAKQVELVEIVLPKTLSDRANTNPTDLAAGR